MWKWDPKKILMPVKFIYSEKATNLFEISTVDLSYVYCISNGQIYGGDFEKNLRPSQNI